MSRLLEYVPPTDIQAMLYQMTELLLCYPDEAQCVAAEALPVPNSFLAEAPTWLPWPNDCNLPAME